MNRTHNHPRGRRFQEGRERERERAKAEKRRWKEGRRSWRRQKREPFFSCSEGHVPWPTGPPLSVNLAASLPGTVHPPGAGLMLADLRLAFTFVSSQLPAHPPVGPRRSSMHVPTWQRVPCGCKSSVDGLLQSQAPASQPAEHHKVI